jgi:hypothetical protein
MIIPRAILLLLIFPAIAFLDMPIGDNPIGIGKTLTVPFKLDRNHAIQARTNLCTVISDLAPILIGGPQ